MSDTLSGTADISPVKAAVEVVEAALLIETQDALLAAVAAQDALLAAVAVTRSGSVAKRLFDVVVAASAIFLAFPLFAFIALMIKWDSRGPVFFCQDRFGQSGKIFRVYKFRSMYTHAADYEGRTQTERSDKRVTRVGRFLRAHSIDEVPQLLNVLIGNMSLVGPRPHAVGMLVCDVKLDTLDNWQQRYSAKPGLTGLAQVSGSRGALPTIDSAYTRLDYDLKYIRGWSFWMDVKILLKTVKVCVKDNRAW